jgi:hypothetical protein
MSRWEHKCPGCAKLVHWRRVFCKECCVKDKRRLSMLLGVETTMIKRQRLPGVLPTVPLIAIKVNDFWMCLSCGKKLRQGFEHRCYWRVVVCKNGHFNCYSCHHSRPTPVFPRLSLNKRTIIRSVVCSTCLDGREIRLNNV